MILALFATLAAMLMLGMLLVRLIIFALPVGVALAAGSSAHASGLALVPSIAVAASAAIMMLLIAQIALGLARTPLQLTIIGLLFALPAAFAGFHAARGIWTIFAAPDTASILLASFSALIFAGLALTQLPRLAFPRDA